MEKKWIQRYFAQWDLQMMVLPAILLVGIFSYIPMYGILMAFQQYNIFEGMKSDQKDLLKFRCAI